MEPIRTLFATQPTEPSETALPEGLRARYDGNLSFPPASEERPYCIANFVSTLDGVVSFNLPGQSEGAQISNWNEEDRFIMGLLRASADAVVVGSGTLQAARSAWFLAPGSCLSGSERFIPKVSNRGAPKTGVSTRSDCHGNGRTGPHQRRVSYTANQGAHTDYGTRQTDVVAKWIGGARLSRGEGAFYGRRAHISFRDPYVAQAGSRSGVAATRSRPDALWRISRSWGHG